MIKDRKKKPFSEAEVRVASTMEGPPPRNLVTEFFDTPISYRENALSLFWDKKPCWAVTTSDFSGVTSDCWNLHLARSREMPNQTDVFGVKWTYVPEVNGSITLGGNPRFTDVNDWKDVIKMPDIEEWDWADDAKRHYPNQLLSPRIELSNGFWFERMISLMDFENAAMALVDEDQRDAINELLTATTDLGIKVMDKLMHYWPSIDGFIIHDDWGSQKSPFFSEDVAREVFLPHMKRLIDHIHSTGRYIGIHSCGHVEDRVGVFIDAGLDTWHMQTMNDCVKLYEEVGDKIIIQITLPHFDANDDKAAVEMAHYYVDNFCKPGKPSILADREALSCKTFKEEVYRYSRKHYLEQN